MNKKFFILNIILNVIMIIMGIVLFKNPAFGLFNPGYYFSIYFMALAFFSFLIYFLCRTKENEENLVLSVISVITAAYLFLCNETVQSYSLAMGIMIFLILFISYKGFIVFKYKDTNSYKWFLELINTLIILIVGLLTVVNLFNEISVQTLIFGYFFISIGTIDLAEMLIYQFIKSPYFRKVFRKVYVEEKKEDFKDLLNK